RAGPALRPGPAGRPAPLPVRGRGRRDGGGRARRGTAGAQWGRNGSVRYAFTGAPDALRVSFACPVCHQRLRVPVRGPVRARCGLCGTVLDCDT
ncbi:hypothetical protein ACFU6R_28175, partial [Streptomyces sp. NPDC057499]